MDKLIIGLVIVSLIVLINGLTREDENWNEYKNRFGKRYKSSKEEKDRRSNWVNNINRINRHNSEYNSGKVTFEMGINSFTEYSATDLQKFLGFKSFAATSGSTIVKRSIRKKRQATSVPTNFSWVSQGAVSPVQNQGACGSCWTFASTGSLEGRYFNKTGKLPVLSKQQLLDCNYNATYGSWGCNGGHYSLAIKYWNANGFQNETSYLYPYMASKISCQANPMYYYKNYKVSSTCNTFNTKGNEAVMKSVLPTKWPVAIGMYVQNSFFYYKSGIYYNTTCYSSSALLNHAVLLVGYGTENGQDYWLVKNSWGTNWGMEGYFKIARNAKNMCGIVTDPCFIDLI